MNSEQWILLSSHLYPMRNKCCKLWPGRSKIPTDSLVFSLLQPFFVFAGLSVSWRDLSLREWSSALRCWWCPTTAVCCSAGDTGTAAFVSLSWGKESWWAGSAGTSVSFLIAGGERFLSFLHWHEVILKNKHFMYVFVKMSLPAWLWICVASTSSLVQETRPA